jgi:ABC-2 type transport system permease protein
VSDRTAGAVAPLGAAVIGAAAVDAAAVDATATATAAGSVAPLAPRARFFPSLAAVYRAQLSRARVARIPLLFVATFQWPPSSPSGS